MRNVRVLLIGVFLVGLEMLTPARAQMVTSQEALNVAQNWITLIIDKAGNWGGAETAQVDDLCGLRRGDRLLGYLFRIQPQGYIAVSLHKGFAPVKAYSDTSDLDPDSEEGMTAVIKDNLVAALDRLEGRSAARISLQGVETSGLPETDHRVTWSYLALDTGTFKARLKSGIITMSYTPGRELLRSKWHQHEPYNLQCPGAGGCAHCPVGCVALAGAQIMHYWAWPPAGIGQHDNISYEDPYNWVWMADEYRPSTTSASGWADGDGKPLTNAQVDAVANLCREVGKAAGMDYSCDESTAWCGDKIGKDMLDAYEDHFRYSTDATFDWQVLESRTVMFQQIRDNINANRPIQYCRGTHSLVLDGWQEVSGVFKGHMNDGSSNGWVDMSDLPGAEGMIREIHPDCSVGTVVSGKHVQNIFRYNYAYFDQDAIPVFPESMVGVPMRKVEYIGFKCQFLPGVILRTYPEGEPRHGVSVRFAGDTAVAARLYSIKGASAASIKVEPGSAIILDRGGCIRFF